MSNKGIRELKRRKRKEAKKKRANIIIKAGVTLAVFGGLAFGFLNRDDGFEIKKQNENRTASATDNQSSSDKVTEQKIYSEVATAIGFEDVNTPEDKEVGNDEYSDVLVSYVKVTKCQYCYRQPNDFSKTDKVVNVGEYLAFYGCENSFAKVKINDNFYYVNRYGLEELDEENSINVISGIICVNENNVLPQDFDPGVDQTAKRAYETMLQDMNRAGLSIKIASDYRGYDLEKKLFESENLDAEEAGTSEHQTGTAFDFFSSNKDQYKEAFRETDEYKWLKDNAYKYGFIERYPEDKEKKTGHKSNPWHFRFVGVDNAKEIYENDLTLEEFLKMK